MNHNVNFVLDVDNKCSMPSSSSVSPSFFPESHLFPPLCIPQSATWQKELHIDQSSQRSDGYFPSVRNDTQFKSNVNEQIPSNVHVENTLVINPPKSKKRNLPELSKRSKGKNWTDDELMILLDLYKQVFHTQLTGTKSYSGESNDSRYDRLAALFAKASPLEERTAKAIRDKITAIIDFVKFVALFMAGKIRGSTGSRQWYELTPAQRKPYCVQNKKTELSEKIYKYASSIFSGRPDFDPPSIRGSNPLQDCKNSNNTVTEELPEHHSVGRKLKKKKIEQTTEAYDNYLKNQTKTAIAVRKCMKSAHAFFKSKTNYTSSTEEDSEEE